MCCLVSVAKYSLVQLVYHIHQSLDSALIYTNLSVSSFYPRFTHRPSGGRHLRTVVRTELDSQLHPSKRVLGLFCQGELHTQNISMVFQRSHEYCHRPGHSDSANSGAI